jgi:N-acetylglutamate synthase-like GNAT family acetyltransferase
MTDHHARSHPVRTATSEDLPKIERLIQLPPGALTSCAQHVLVVDGAHDDLAAVAVVAIAPPQAHLETLVMAPDCASRKLEARLVGVSEALAEAFGCAALDVPARVAA